MKKYLLTIFSVLTLCVLTFAFASCGDNDENGNDNDNTIPTAEQLVGSIWRGLNTNTAGYVTVVKVNSITECLITVYAPDGAEYDKETCSCTYDEKTGAFWCSYTGGVSGYVIGNTMQLTSSLYGTFTLKRQ